MPRELCGFGSNGAVLDPKHTLVVIMQFIHGISCIGSDDRREVNEECRFSFDGREILGRAGGV
jgi:hypothetical protein